MTKLLNIVPNDRISTVSASSRLCGFCHRQDMDAVGRDIGWWILYNIMRVIVCPAKSLHTEHR